MKTVFDFLSEHWLVISPLLLEFLLRIIPSEKNYSLVRAIKLGIELLDHIIPNRGKEGKKHRIVKALLFFALVGIYGNTYAQLNTVTRQIRFSTGVQAATDTAATNGNRGRIWYDFVTHRFRANENGTNTFLIGGTGGNFWPLDGSGVFSSNVDIDGDGNTLTFTNMSSFQYISPGLTSLLTIDDSKINFSSPLIESLSKHFFTPTSTRSSINLGILAGDPSALVNGDIWYNSSLGVFRGRAGGSTFSFGAGTTPGGADTEVQFNDGGVFNAESGLRWIKSPSNTLVISNSGGTFSTTLNGATIQGSSTIALASTGNNTVTINAGTGNITHTGKALFNPTATEAGLNLGSLAGDPSSPDDGDNWYNSSAGYYRFRKTGSTYIDLGTTGLTAGRIPFPSSTDNLIDEAALTYDATNNFILLSNPASTFTSTIFGGEIQLDDIAGSDDCTINDSGIQFTGSASNEIATDSDLIFNVTDDIFLTTVPDAGTTANSLLTRNTGTGEIETITVASIATSNVYTPSYNIVSNIDAITTYNLSYLNIGNYYQISGQVGIDVTAAGTLTSFEISIPIAGTLVTNSAGGTGCNSTNVCFSIDEDSTQLQATFTSGASTSNEVYNFTVGYTLQGI